MPRGVKGILYWRPKLTDAEGASPLPRIPENAPKVIPHDLRYRGYNTFRLLSSPRKGKQVRMDDFLSHFETKGDADILTFDHKCSVTKRWFTDIDFHVRGNGEILVQGQTVLSSSILQGNYTKILCWHSTDLYELWKLLEEDKNPPKYLKVIDHNGESTLDLSKGWEWNLEKMPPGWHPDKIRVLSIEKEKWVWKDLSNASDKFQGRYL